MPFLFSPVRVFFRGIQHVGQHVAVDARELTLRLCQLLVRELAFLPKLAKALGLLLQPVEFPVDGAQCHGGGGVGIVTHTIPSYSIVRKA